MRRITFLILISVIACPLYGFQNEAIEIESTTLIFVRHAERAEDGTRNPPISEEGIQRAQNLANVLVEMDAQITQIYSTPYKRTQMTAAPTAELLSLEVNEYGFDDLENWLTTLIDQNNGNAILIVGHSNTTPRLINMVLGEEKFEQLDEHAYGDLFILRTSSYGSGEIELSTF